MTPLRQRMIDDLCRYNYAPRTQQAYVAQIARLARHFSASPDQLTRQQVQQYQDLLTSKRVSWLPQAVAAMQFLYNKTLERDWTITHSFRPKANRRPVVLTLQEVLAATGRRRAAQSANAADQHVWMRAARLRGDAASDSRCR